jgi:hypothetical protein
VAGGGGGRAGRGGAGGWRGREVGGVRRCLSLSLSLSGKQGREQGGGEVKWEVVNRLIMGFEPVGGRVGPVAQAGRAHVSLSTGSG